MVDGQIKCYCSQVGTFGTESAVRKRGGSRNLPYLNAKPRQIPLLDTYACIVTKPGYWLCEKRLALVDPCGKEML